MVFLLIVLIHLEQISATYLPINSQTHLLTNSQPMFVGMAYFAYFCKTKARNSGGQCAIGHASHARKRSKREPSTCPLAT